MMVYHSQLYISITLPTYTPFFFLSLKQTKNAKKGFKTPHYAKCKSPNPAYLAGVNDRPS